MGRPHDLEGTEAKVEIIGEGREGEGEGELNSEFATTKTVHFPDELSDLMEEGRVLLERLDPTDARAVAELVAQADRCSSPVVRALRVQIASPSPLEGGDNGVSALMEEGRVLLERLDSTDARAVAELVAQADRCSSPVVRALRAQIASPSV